MSLSTPKLNNKVRAGILSAILAATTLTAGAASSATPNAGLATQPLDQAVLLDTGATTTGTAVPTAKKSGKWIEYNLSNYCVYLHDGDAVVFKTCQTSSGKKGYGTPAGEFKVYKKAAGPICMQPPGDDKVCNIHYATFWRKGGYAFHEAWWMGDRVNQRISHGCVNMRKGDAKTVYDFATVGMRVSVHW